MIGVFIDPGEKYEEKKERKFFQSDFLRNVLAENARGPHKQDRDEKIRRASAPARASKPDPVAFPACPDPLCPKKGTGK